MTNEPREGEWPTVEDPRACLRAVEEARKTEGPKVDQAPLNYTSAKLLARVKHEDSILKALAAARAMIDNVMNMAGCAKPDCFPNCMAEPHRTHWINTNAALREEAEAREQRRQAE